MVMRIKINIKACSIRKWLVENAKQVKKNKQKEYVSTLKETLKSCETNPIESGPAKIIIIGLETWS